MYQKNYDIEIIKKWTDRQTVESCDSEDAPYTLQQSRLIQATIVIIGIIFTICLSLIA